MSKNEMLTNVFSNRSKQLATFSPIKTLGSERAFSQTHSINNKSDFQTEQNGKIHEKDVPAFFYSLTGVKNFDNSGKIKAQFDKNPGYSSNFVVSKSNVKIEKDNLINSSSKSVPLKMDFNLFVKSFENLSKRIYRDKNIDEAFLWFLENDIKKAIAKHDNKEIDKTFLTELLKSLRREDVIELLKDIHPIIHPHFENFAEPTALMNFNGFLEFYKSFALFPDMISLVKLKNLFFTLSDLYELFYFQQLFLL